MKRLWVLLIIVAFAFAGCQAKVEEANAQTDEVVENEIVVDVSDAVEEVAETEEVTIEQPPVDIGFGEIIEQLPALKQGVFYNALDSKVGYVSTMEIARYKNLSIEFGYSPEITALGVISYPIVKLKDLGITAPVLDLIEFNVGIAAGAKRLQFVNPEGGNEFVWGPTITLINIKW
jgi:hypothetical protein